MSRAEILSLAYQLRAAGVPGTLAELIAMVEADALLLQPPPPAVDQVVGHHRRVNLDGSIDVFELVGPANQPHLIEHIDAPPAEAAEGA